MLTFMLLNRTAFITVDLKVVIKIIYLEYRVIYRPEMALFLVLLRDNRDVIVVSFVPPLRQQIGVVVPTGE